MFLTTTASKKAKFVNFGVKKANLATLLFPFHFPHKKGVRVSYLINSPTSKHSHPRSGCLASSVTRFLQRASCLYLYLFLTKYRSLQDVPCKNNLYKQQLWISAECQDGLSHWGKCRVQYLLWQHKM